MKNKIVEYICYWNNGNICEHYTMLNGLLHGEWGFIVIMLMNKVNL